MCSPGGVTLQPIYCRRRSSADQIHQVNVGATTSGLPSVLLSLIYIIIMSAHFFMMSLGERERKRERASEEHPAGLSFLSPGFSNWNLSLQNERVQGLAGY